MRSLLPTLLVLAAVTTLTACGSGATGLGSSAAGSSPRPSASASPSPTPPAAQHAAAFLTVDSARHRVDLRLVAALTPDNGGMNFNGYSKGAMTVTVPAGWQVRVSFTNRGPLPHSVAVVAGPTATTPAFAGAGAPLQALTAGIPAGQTMDFTFVAARPGRYRLACLVPGHEAAGMWDRVVVTSGGQPSINP
ncbi:MAG: multicopper oxidase domain-containing protein [Firmicutes bacterium]|nr:multicopper oxidase domain-containing protein [Bacillota bacterium]